MNQKNNIGKEVKKITNKESSHFGKDCHVVAYLAEEKVELFLIEEELLVVLPLNYIAKTSQVYKPTCRREFYEFVQNKTNSRVDIENTISLLLNEKLLVLTDITKEELFDLFKDEWKDRKELVDDFRLLRDNGKMDFTLVNNIYDPKAKKAYNPHHKKKNFNNYKKPIQGNS